jgi:hypothetical protein
VKGQTEATAKNRKPAVQPLSTTRFGEMDIPKFNFKNSNNSEGGKGGFGEQI